ncbi:MAG TPA: cation transporter [Bacteroidales bacterium]|jgi:cation diffusion facilitator family transporter|nr:cation transporter [Bacteroidales bacterium]
MKKDANYLKYLEGWLSIFVNIFLFVIKYWAGIVTGSVAIIADAWHTLSDSISSVVVLVSVKVSSKPADKEHPFGHGRAELIASIIIGMILAVIAFEFVLESFQKLKNHEAVHFGKIAIIATVISIIVKELLAQFAFWAGKKTKSVTLKADAWHHRSDAISSVIILVGIFLGPYFWWIDGVLGMIVAIMIFYAAYEIIRDASNPLMGEEPDIELVNQISEIAKQKSGWDAKVHHIHLHRYGDHTELTFHIKLPKEMNLEKAHDVCSQIEKTIKSDLNIEATIHSEPF